MEQELRDRLLNSIENDRLVLFCGAGLSMAVPSRVPSAVALAGFCKQKYEREIGATLPGNFATDLEAQAEHFATNDQLVQTFIRRLIPREPFRRDPNAGHFAIADFLSSEVVDFVLSTNVDRLVEVAAEDLGEPQAYVALDGLEANLARAHRPHIKLHGCLYRDEANTIWCKSQLDKEPVRERLTELQTWIGARLQGRDVVFLGFWSDWAYLNAVFESSVTSIENALVVIVNPSNDANLEAKAKGLWDWSARPGITRRIVRESASDFLAELRKLMWINFVNRLLRQSETTFVQLGGSAQDGRYEIASDALNTDEAYRLRLDACGIPYRKAARQKRPDVHMNKLGVVQLGLLARGAQLEGNQFVLNEQRIRVLNGQGQLLGVIKGAYADEPAQFPRVDLMICVGATDDGNMPQSVVRGDSSAGTTVRATGGAKWQNEDNVSDLWRINQNVATP
jgi:NAD-dependent SIR2 family protein deacetylase